MKKNNSVHEMVEALKEVGHMTENEIHKTVFGYGRNNSYELNKE